MEESINMIFWRPVPLTKPEIDNIITWRSRQLAGSAAGLNQPGGIKNK